MKYNAITITNIEQHKEMVRNENNGLLIKLANIAAKLKLLIAVTIKGK